MTKEDKFFLLAIESADVDAAGLVVLGVVKVAHIEQEVIAVGKKDGPAVGIELLVAGKKTLGDLSRSAAVGVDAPDGATRVGFVNDDVAASPTPSAGGHNAGQHSRRAT